MLDTEVRNYGYANKDKVLHLFTNHAKYRNCHNFDKITRAKHDKAIRCVNKKYY